MSLPLVLEVVIGLVFIYLALSLLASEIQELLTTLFQWRAAHLKKAIEVLLTGSQADKEYINNLDKARELVQGLYTDPLIENISQEPREGIEAGLRRLSRAIVAFGRSKDQITLRGNEPSYIPSETFATSLLEKLNLSQFAHELTALKLKAFADVEIASRIRTLVEGHGSGASDDLWTSLSKDLTQLERVFNDICTAFSDTKATLLTSVYRLRDELGFYIEKTEERLSPEPDLAPLVEQLTALQKGIFYRGSAEYDNIDEVVRRLQPSLAQVLNIFIGNAKELRQEYETLVDSGLFDRYEAIEARAQTLAQQLPKSLQASLAVLARRAEINLSRAKRQVEFIQDELKQFQAEVQTWFDRSMERASGVYKRNARGIGFLIGFGLALLINADTFHIATVLATNTALRQALVSSAEVVTAECSGLPASPEASPAPTAPQPTSGLPILEQPAVAQVPPAAPADPAAPVAPVAPVEPAAAPVVPDPTPAASPSPTAASSATKLQCINDAVRQETMLPLGWGEANRNQQLGRDPDSNQPNQNIPFLLWLRIPLGWIVSGLAISMGASFWFDLLGKLVNVRNAGKRPDPAANVAPANTADR